MAEVMFDKVADGESHVEEPIEKAEPTPESQVEGQDPVKADDGAEGLEGLREKAKAAAKGEAKAEPTLEEGAQAVADDWKPDFKLKVLDEEKEIEEWARPLINKENEKQIKDLFTKAYAADHLKTRRDEAIGKVQEYETQLQGYVGRVEKIRATADKDFGRFLQEINYPPAKVMAWVRGQLERHEFLQRDDIPAEVKKAYTDQEEHQKRAWELEEQNQQLSSSHVDVAVQAKTAELTRSLDREDAKEFATTFDSRLAKPGAFREFVIQHAANVFSSSKGARDLTAEEAVNETLRILGATPAQGGSAGAASPKPNAPANAPTVVTASPKKTVIPNVGSGSAVAMGKKPRSLDDLRKMAKEARS